MKLSVFDLHCDTASEMLRQKEGFDRNPFAVSLEKASSFESYIQVMAHFISPRMSDDEGWEYLLSMHQNLLHDPAVREGRAPVTSACPKKDAHCSLLLALEDARVFGGRIERVEELFRMGFRIVTPLWGGDTSMGGSHNTEHGLTAFGARALSRAMKLGMIVDISHASVASAEEIFQLAKEHQAPVIASHSNSYHICPVSRNLRDGQVESILESGGVIGLNFYKAFLREDGVATLANVFPHIDHFLELGAQDALCLGGDMDGCDLPDDLPDLSAYELLAERMLAHNYSEELVKNIFFENAYRFAQKHLKNTEKT